MFKASILSVDTTHSRYYRSPISPENFYFEAEAENINYHSKYFSTDSDSIMNYHIGLDNSVLDSGLLPPGLRYSIPGFLIFERPPTTKLVQYVDYTVSEMSGDYQEDEDEDEDSYDSYTDFNPDDHLESYLIPIPWQIYFVHYSLNPNSKYRTLGIKMFFANQPLNHPDVRLYAPYVNNFFTNGSLCNPMFENDSEINRYPQNLSGVIASAYDWIWNTGFNKDLSETISQTVYQANHGMISNHIAISSVGRNFYSTISKYSPEDVVSLEWANPSYTSNFDLDNHYVFKNSSIYKKMFKQKYGHSYGSEDSDTQLFKDMVGGSVYNIQKTYSSLIKHLFTELPAQWNSNYFDYKNLLSTDSTSFANLEHYFSRMIQLTNFQYIS